ncbi:MAG: hypothetical protein ACRENY_00135 [Candidatus Dormibacteria bacterium]
MANDLRLLRLLVSHLERAGFSVLVFGGWAEDLLGLTPRSGHRDVDLILLDPEETALDDFLGLVGEIPEKHASHKRAFEVEGTLVELFIASNEGGAYVTWFCDQLRWQWPIGVAAKAAGLPVASPEALASYRTDWAAIQAVRQPSL